MSEVIRHSHQESLYEAVIRSVREIEVTGEQRRIAIASIHALAEHQAHRASDLTRALRDAMLDRVRTGWTLHRIASVTSPEGLAREVLGLDLIDTIPNARVEVRALVVDAMPALAPLIIGGRVAFVSSEDDRDFAALDGLEFRSPETVDAVQRYFDLLWRDPRAIRLRTSAGAKLELGVARVEAEIRAFSKYQRHRLDSGLRSGAAEDIEAYLSSERRFDAEMKLRKALGSVRGTVLWYEAHHSVNALDALYEGVKRSSVDTIRLLSSDANLRGNPKRTVASFKKFADDLAQDARINCEWRIIADEVARNLHGRVVLDDEGAIMLPPLNSILKGTVDVIRHAGKHFDRSPYLTAWESAEPLDEWKRRQLGS